MTTPSLPVNKIAFVLDGVVQDVFHTEDRLAALLLSNPIIVDVTAEYANLPEGTHLVGYTYDGSTFTPPVINVETVPTPGTATSDIAP